MVVAPTATIQASYPVSEIYRHVHDLITEGEITRYITNRDRAAMQIIDEINHMRARKTRDPSTWLREMEPFYNSISAYLSGASYPQKIR